jgi:hypothetical protein
VLQSIPLGEVLMNTTILLALIAAFTAVFLLQKFIVRSIARKGERAASETTRSTAL